MLLTSNHHSCHFLLPVSVKFVQSLSHVWLFVTPWTAAHQASLSITNSRWVYPNSCQFLSPHQYMRTPVEVNPDWFLLFSITSSSNTLEGHQRHLNLFIAYVNGYLLWWSPESWKLLPSATLHTSCVLDQCFWMCGPWISNISMNWKLVRNTKSWAPSQTYQKLWE